MTLNYEEQIAKIQKLAKDLWVQASIIQEGEEYLADAQKENFEKIAKLEAKRADLDNSIAEIRLEMKEAEPENTEAVEEATNKRAKLIKEIKALCHRLPVARLAKRGIKIFDDKERPRVGITISKAQTARIYDTDRLLDSKPEIAQMKVDGDRAVQRQVMPDVIDRLIADDRLEEAEVYSFSTLVPKRAPSVKFKIDGEG